MTIMTIINEIKKIAEEIKHGAEVLAKEYSRKRQDELNNHILITIEVGMKVKSERLTRLLD